ncbi:MAG: hypothetical protein JXR41_10115 [Bacteroidales bacterium]|nr:hypothetical protein [Bacteroidales bacterium]MBN2763435.1 hypothetical protein [Bacteroidales bacterium]
MKLMPSYFSPILFIMILSIVFSCEEDPDVINFRDVGQWKTYNTSNGLKDNFIWAVKQDRNGIIWVGTNDGGVSRYDGHGWTNYSTKNGLLSNCVYAIEQDVFGAIWFGTDSGLNYMSNNIIYSIEGGIVAFSMYSDSRSQLWIGTDAGIIRANAQKWDYYHHDSLDYNTIYCIMEDNEKRIWFATEGGAMFFNGSSFVMADEIMNINPDNISCILQDSWGALWFSSAFEKYLIRYDIKRSTTELVSLLNGSSFSFVMSMVEDRNRNIWFSTYGDGIVKYNGAEMQSFKVGQGLTDNHVYCSMMDREGNLWFGTRYGGINVYITE